MFLTRSDYDRGVNTFSPEGRLFQVEYATESIKLGATALAIRTKEGIVITSEKRLASPLVVAKSLHKIAEIDHHICATYSGISADARTLLDHARLKCQNHWFTYNEQMNVEACAQTISDLALGFGEKNREMSRPFGVALLIAGEDKREGTVLYHTDPAGAYTRYEAKAIGSGGENAQNLLEKYYDLNMSLESAKKLALQIMKDSMEEEINGENIDMAVVNGGKFCIMKSEEINKIIPDLKNTLVGEGL